MAWSADPAAAANANITEAEEREQAAAEAADTAASDAQLRAVMHQVVSAAIAAIANVIEAAEREQAAAGAAAGASITPATLPADVPTTLSLSQNTKKAAHPPTRTARQAIAVVAVQTRNCHTSAPHLLASSC